MTAAPRRRSTGFIAALLVGYLAVLAAVIGFAAHIPTWTGITIIVVVAVVEVLLLVRRYRTRKTTTP